METLHLQGILMEMKFKLSRTFSVLQQEVFGPPSVLECYIALEITQVFFILFIYLFFVAVIHNPHAALCRSTAASRSKRNFPPRLFLLLVFTLPPYVCLSVQRRAVFEILSASLFNPTVRMHKQHLHSEEGKQTFVKNVCCRH